MKIILYGLNYTPEEVGIGKYSGELVNWLASRGHNVRVITSQPYFPIWKIRKEYKNRFNIAKQNGIFIIRCPLWVPESPSGLTRLIHLASFALSSFPIVLGQLSWKPDVVITVAPAFFCTHGALVLGALCGRNTSTWLHIQDFELDAAFQLGLLKGKLLRKIAESWERYTLRSFDRVSSISTAMVERLEAKGVDPNRKLLMPNWVNLELIRPQLGKDHIENIYRRELEINANQLVLMYSGSMNRKQGLEVLVEVIHMLADIPEVVWLFAGEGPTKRELVEATRGMTHVRHLSLQPMERLNDWLNAADIHLLPQKAEAADLVLPSKLLGILASGKPVVASSPSGSELAAIASQAGACVPPGDAVSFANTLRKLIASPEERAKAGRRGRMLANRAFGMNSVLGSFEQELNTLVDKENRKAST